MPKKGIFRCIAVITVAKLADVVGVDAIVLRRHSPLCTVIDLIEIMEFMFILHFLRIAFMLTISFAPFCRLMQW